MIAQWVIHYLIWKLQAGIMECGHQVMGKPLQLRLITNVDFPGISHGNSIQCTSTMHAQRSSVHHLEQTNKKTSGNYSTIVYITFNYVLSCLPIVCK